MSYPLPPFEPQRLTALHRLSILDTPPSPAMDRICRIAQKTFDMPTALIAFLDTDRLWIKAKSGAWDWAEVPREHAICNYTVLHDEVFVVPDLASHDALKANPCTTGGPRFRFYAGAPLIIGSGIRLGALCVLDTRPRDFGPDKAATLAGLARLVVDELWLQLLEQTGRTQSDFDFLENDRATLDFERDLPLTNAHIRAARALLNWSMADLADAAGVSPMTIKRIEWHGCNAVRAESLLAVLSALENAGITFSHAPDRGTGLYLKEERGSTEYRAS
jgi:GAF domain-containing protein